MCEYLYYAEFSIILLNYNCYMDINNYKLKYKLYYKYIVTIHLLIYIYSRIYKLGIIGVKVYYNFPYIFNILHIILYCGSIHWCYTQINKLVYD